MGPGPKDEFHPNLILGTQARNQKPVGARHLKLQKVPGSALRLGPEEMLEVN